MISAPLNILQYIKKLRQIQHWALSDKGQSHCRSSKVSHLVQAIYRKLIRHKTNN